MACNSWTRNMLETNTPVTIAWLKTFPIARQNVWWSLGKTFNSRMTTLLTVEWQNLWWSLGKKQKSLTIALQKSLTIALQRTFLTASAWTKSYDTTNNYLHWILCVTYKHNWLQLNPSKSKAIVTRQNVRFKGRFQFRLGCQKKLGYVNIGRRTLFGKDVV